MNEPSRALARDSLIAGVTGLLIGIAIHFITLYFRDNGPSWGDFSLRGNGAIIFLLLALLIWIIGIVMLIARRAWLAIAVFSVALFAGLFLIFGTV